MISAIKVLDLTRVLAGPLCCMMLGDMGADVIKVERPGEGDETRGWGPPFAQNGESAYYLSINRNKIGISLDLNSPSERDRLLQLVREADVLVENFKPGTLAARGLSPESLQAENPRLIVCTIAGFAREPERLGYDFVVQAESGWMSITGDPDGAPMKHGIALADVLAGKDAAIAILAALVERAATGRARHVKVTLQETAEAALVNVAQNTMVSGNAPKRWGNAHANLVPYQVFQARDRAIVIAAGNDAQFAACARALDLGALAADERFRTNANRLANRIELIAIMGERISSRDSAFWKRVLDENDVPNGVVKTVQDVLAVAGASPLTGMPPSVPGSVRRPPPMLGEHNEIVGRLGWRAFDSL